MSYYQPGDPIPPLPLALTADVVAAVVASFCVSPFITVVDKSIISNASGRQPLGAALKEGLVEIFARPHRFLARREFRLIWGLYTGTYITANAVESLYVEYGRSYTFPKFIATSVVNMVLCILKDRAFTRMFGTVAPKGLPVATYGLFAGRDALTIAASFTMPKEFSQYLQTRHAMARSTADTVSQLTCPAMVQFISTPVHLLGLDLYNRPGVSGMNRFHFIRAIYLSSSFARIGRIGPAFGIGGVGNNVIRQVLRKRFLQEKA